MNKILKVALMVFGVIVVFFVLAVVLIARQIFPGTSSDSRVNSLGGMSQGTTFSNPMAADSGISEKMMTSSTAPSIEANDLQNLPEADKKIIKNGNLSLKVDSADKTAEKISAIAKGNGGEVASSNFYQSSSNVKNGTVTVKVPVANFEKAFAEIKKVASLVLRESTSGQDVTEQYVDLKAQLANRQAEEQSFIKILDQAQKIDDVLSVTRELARVRGNIEQLQGKIKYLESQTDMSTISVSLTEDANITVVDSWRPLQVVKEAFNSLVKSLQGIVNFLIILLIVIVPFLLIWVIIIWFVYRIGKKIYLRIKNGKQV